MTNRKLVPMDQFVRNFDSNMRTFIPPGESVGDYLLGKVDFLSDNELRLNLEDHIYDINKTIKVFLPGKTYQEIHYCNQYYPPEEFQIVEEWLIGVGLGFIFEDTNAVSQAKKTSSKKVSALSNFAKQLSDIAKVIDREQELLAESNKMTQQGSSDSKSAAPLPPKDQPGQLLENSDHSDHSEKECSVCLDAKPNVVFLPCGHVTACQQCSQQINTCPLCREVIDSFHRVYL